jgi:hypothetical protein
LDLQAYLAARNIYLRGDIARMEGRPIAALAAYTESARSSPDFAPGFVAARLFATQLADSHPARSQAALDTLAALLRAAESVPRLHARPSMSEP